MLKKTQSVDSRDCCPVPLYRPGPTSLHLLAHTAVAISALT